MPVTLLIDVAEGLLNDALGGASAVEITHVAIGDGNGAAYDPSYAQTTLRRELARRPIDRRMQVGTNQWRTLTNFPAGGTPITVREVGFFDATGRLIAIWAGLDVAPRYTGATDFELDQTMAFSRVASGLIEVVAVDDELWDYALADLAAAAAGVTRALSQNAPSPENRYVTYADLQAALQQLTRWAVSQFRTI